MRYLRLPLLALLIAPLLQGIVSPRADAQRVQSIFSSRIQQGNAYPLSVYPGYGLNLFFQTGEKIKKAWLDDPTQIALDFDARPPAATLIHLRNIAALHFPGMRRSPDGTTLLSILTDNDKLYQFKLKAAEGMPKYTALNIVSDNQGTPLIDINTYRRGSLEDVERGLQIAQSRKLLGVNTSIAARVMNFTALVRNGESLTTAASKAGISMAVVSKLADMGQNPASVPTAPPPLTRPSKTLPTASPPLTRPSSISEK